MLQHRARLCHESPTCCKHHPRACAGHAVTEALPRWERYFSPADLCSLYFVEIGANCGTDNCSHSVDPFWSYQRRYGWSGAVIEANPHTFTRLRSNYAPYPRVRPLNLAVSNVTGRLDFYCPLPGKGTAEMCTLNGEWAGRLGWQTAQHRQQVDALSLTQLWAMLKPQRVGILGVDVEGVEERLLAHGELPEPRPRLVFFENTSFGNPNVHRDGPAALRRLRANLARQGYESKRFAESGHIQDELWVHASHRIPTSGSEMPTQAACPARA